MKTFTTITLCLALFACKKEEAKPAPAPAPAAAPAPAPAPAPAAAANEHEKHHEGEPEHAHGAPGTPVATFHDALAPLWHADEGDKRTADTCAAVDHMLELAAPMMTAPAGAKADYVDAAKNLTNALVALKAECAGDKKAFGEKFGAVHEAFHAVAERAAQ